MLNLAKLILENRVEFMESINNLIDENAYRFVAILNKKVGTGRLMNALGHLTAGLAGKGCQEDMQFFKIQR
jgi:malonyl CoA-acyl carrier protein transacylase